MNTRNQAALTTPLIALLKAAYEESGAKLPEDADLKTRYREWGYKKDEGEVLWQNPDFGRLSIQVMNCSVIDVEQGMTNIRGKLLTPPRPKQITLWMFAKEAEDVEILHFGAGEMTNCTATPVPALTVPIQWKDQHPHTRERGKDNIDLVFLRKDGTFMQLQVSVTTRRGYFWISVQEIYQGQIVRTVQAKAKDLGLTFHQFSQHTGLVVPARSEDAFPESDYLKVFPEMGPQLVEFAIGNDRSQQLHACIIADWIPIPGFLTQSAETDGFKICHITYFNLVCGLGNAVCADGKLCFIHFNQIVDRQGQRIANGDFPALEPGQPVAVKWGNGPDGRRKATEVRLDPEVLI